MLTLIIIIIIIIIILVSNVTMSAGRLLFDSGRAHFVKVPASCLLTAYLLFLPQGMGIVV